jgi:hypothetical protein
MSWRAVDHWQCQGLHVDFDASCLDFVILVVYELVMRNLITDVCSTSMRSIIGVRYVVNLVIWHPEYSFCSEVSLKLVQCRFYAYWGKSEVQVYDLLAHWRFRELSLVNYLLVVILLMIVFSRLNIMLFWLMRTSKICLFHRCNICHNHMGCYARTSTTGHL